MSSLEVFNRVYRLETQSVDPVNKYMGMYLCSVYCTQGQGEDLEQIKNCREISFRANSKRKDDLDSYLVHDLSPAVCQHVLIYYIVQRAAQLLQ